MANFSDAIWPVQNLSGATSFPVGYQVEEAGQSILSGTPVMVKAADGGLQAWDGTTLPGIAGILAENSNNLGTTGAGAPVGFSPITGPGSVVGSYAANPYQPSAVVTPAMVPMSDGRLRYFIAVPGTVFIAKIGTSVSVTPVATAYGQVGVNYGLTKDSGNSFWYVDTNKTNAVTVVAISPLEPIGTVGGHVFFVFQPGAASISA